MRNDRPQCTPQPLLLRNCNGERPEHVWSGGGEGVDGGAEKGAGGGVLRLDGLVPGVHCTGTRGAEGAGRVWRVRQPVQLPRPYGEAAPRSI